MARRNKNLTPVASELGDKGSPVMDNPSLTKLLNLPLVDSIPPALAAQGKKVIEAQAPINLNNPPKDDNLHRVTLMKDSLLEYPDLFYDIHVLGPEFEERQFAQMFIRGRCKKAKSLETADLVIFTGGADVDPALYGEVRHESTHISPKRDNDDLTAYCTAMDLGIPMLGICRGAQFLHVMNGGKLYQDVDNHNGDHPMYDIRGKQRIDRVSSVHHQMVIPQNTGGFELIGTANVARERWANPTECVKGTKIDVEAFWYRDTCAIGIQGHPEYRGYNRFAQWTLQLINDLVAINPDIEWRDGKRRMKADIMAQRDIRLKEAAGVLS